MTSYDNCMEDKEEETRILSIEHGGDDVEGSVHVEGANGEEITTEADDNEEWIELEISQWNSFLQFLNINKEIEDIQLSDFEGKKFVSMEQAESFYFLYEKMMGFSVRKKLKRGSNNGIFIRSWVCSSEGLREYKYCNMENRSRDPRGLTKIGCKAQFRINLNRKSNHWVVKCFDNHHNHRLAFAYEKPFLRSHRKLKGHILEQGMAMKRAGMKTSQIHNYLIEVHDGWENVGCLKDDLYRGIVKKYSVWDNCDTSKAMGFLEGKKRRDDKFFYKYALDDENRLTNLFWSDSTSQVDYQLFGDCLTFDATYKTNRYAKPLVILLVSNNHNKTCVYGAALLENETSETYVWVLETFLECMNDKVPETVLTDGCKSMNKALDIVIPGNPHRICSWNLLKNAVHHIHKDGFLADLRKLIFRFYEDDEWEENWKNMVEKYSLAGNVWLDAQHVTRKQWADTFLRGYFFGGARATSRCESMNAFLKRNLESEIPLWMFLRHFDNDLAMLRYNELKENFRTNMTEALPNQTSMPCLEDEVASIFTREIYKKIKNEMQRADKYIVVKVDEEKFPGFTVCSVKKYGTDCSGMKRNVIFSKDMDYVHCDCYSLETKGIPCRHIFISMKNLEVRTLPICLINRRWLKDAKDIQSLPHGNERKCPHPEVIENSRYGGITAQTTILCYFASRSQPAFRKAMKVVSELNLELEQMHPADKEFESTTVQNEEESFPNNILDSKKCKTKGRPTIASTSKKKKTPHHCKVCRETGHDIRNCPQKPT